MGLETTIIEAFVNVTRGIAGIVNQFGKPVADIMHSLLPNLIPADALIGTGTLIILTGYGSYKVIESPLIRLATIFLLGGVFLLVASNPTNGLGQTLINQTK